MIKRAVTSLARRAGYTIVPTWQLNTFQGYENLRRLFELLSVDLVIDVGANEGQFRDALRKRVGYAGRVVSFEPTPELVRRLIERARSDALWDVHAKALGADAGTATLNVMENTEFNSFLKPRNDDVALFESLNSVRETVEVEVTTVDEVLPGLLARHAAKAVFLKLDTQGFDLEVLKGAEASLRSIAGLQLEASVRSIYEGAPRYRDVIDFASERGFVASGFFANNEGHFPQLIEFDCQMIRAGVGGS